MHGGTCSPFPPPPPNSPASEAASPHLSQQAPRESRLVIGCGERAALPAAVTRGFRYEAKAGEAVRASAVGSLPRLLEGRGDQKVCRPDRFRPVRRITQIPREVSGRGAGLRPLRMRGRLAPWEGARGVGGCVRARARVGAHVGPGRRGRDRESSVPPRQSPARNLSRAWRILRGPHCAGKRPEEKEGLSSPAPGAAPRKPARAHRAPLTRQTRREPLVTSGERRPVCFWKLCASGIAISDPG